MTGQTTNGQTNDNKRTNKPTMPTKTRRKKSLSSFIEKLSLLNEKKQLFIRGYVLFIEIGTHRTKIISNITNDLKQG